MKSRDSILFLAVHSGINQQKPESDSRNGQTKADEEIQGPDGVDIHQDRNSRYQERQHVGQSEKPVKPIPVDQKRHGYGDDHEEIEPAEVFSYH